MAIPAAPAEIENLNSMGAQWWQWALSIPGKLNPMLGSYGNATNPLPDQCVIGQSGSVWFLAGTFAGGTATRTCTVPEDKSLFFPLVNSINFNTPNCGQNSQSLSASQVRMLAAAGLAGATYSATLDGSAIQNVQLIESPVFDVALPGRDNVYNFFFGTPCSSTDPSLHLQAGVYSPSADLGYYVLLDPLNKGVHKLHIKSTIPGSPNPIEVDVTYTLNVVAVSEN